MKDVLIGAVDKYRSLILDTLDYIWKNPEMGYREVKTSKYMEEAFEKLGYTLVKPDDITGFYTVLDTGKSGPEILILGELDSLVCREHPDADKETGAVHCCGHAAQCAALVGIAAALKEKNALDGLCGKIRLCAVPAEELIEIEYRSGLMKDGIIKYYGGKSEFLHRGYFDGVDMAFMVHTSVGKAFSANLGSVGCVAKRIEYKGVSAHAGGAPWDGCNALYAANLGLNAINAIRETFKEPDIIRVHPIITTGGAVVNAIPDKVVVESYVRSSNFEAMKDANDRVNRALCGAALSIGANVDIRDNAGYSPLNNCEQMLEVAKEAAEKIGVEYVFHNTMSSGSTDMGDLSAIMPVVQPYAPGAVGTDHGVNYYIENSDLACVGSAKWQLMMLKLLLENGAERAYKIIKEFKPKFASKKEYFEYVDSFKCEGNRIEYNSGTATVKMW